MTNVHEKNIIILFVTTESAPEQAAKHEQYAHLSALARDRGFSIAGCFAVPEPQFVLGFSHALASCFTHQAKIILLDHAHSLLFSYKELSEALTSLISKDISLMLGDGSLIGVDFLTIFLTMLKTSAEIEKKQRSKRIKNSLQLITKKGRTLGGRKYGSIPEEARIIRQILQLDKEGKSLEAICLMLTANNIKTLQNKKWYPTTVKRLIERHKKT